MQVEENKVVSVTYRIEDEAGETVERIDIPVSFLYGEKSGLFKKVNEAIDGMKVGDEASVVLEPSEGFGDYNHDLTFTDQIENVPPEYQAIGSEAEFSNENGETRKFVVTHVDAGTVTLDGNHPFAGKTMTFHLKITDVREPTADELTNGVSQTPGGVGGPTVH
ncbi:MAG: FKBP-type peptidyl-prolyl cis-trans isomerase [Gammaproteobacteria bacterium]|nr:FKBP-type peptidyl-prolyl cis-trans isomerase [Gammaproteobacteria bacterium]MCW8982982.1 FKBP-type peptidyl-prolyl cis-trans isomerase [Gammaproteobacteria bacterium]